MRQSSGRRSIAAQRTRIALQLFDARRFGFSLGAYPRLARVDAARAALPEMPPDAGS